MVHQTVSTTNFYIFLVLTDFFKTKRTKLFVRLAEFRLKIIQINLSQACNIGRMESQIIAFEKVGVQVLSCHLTF